LQGAAGSIIYSLYVIIDLKLISSKIEIDDYILGAMTLYIDLITLFIHILQLIGSRK
jgi:FtsH-binding integral membrane protein